MKSDLIQREPRTAFLLLLILVASLSGCDFMRHTHCEDKVLGQQRSPDGKIIAISYARSCASNTGLYTWVGLQDTSMANQPNAEIEPVLTMKGTHEVTVAWEGAGSLEIRSPGLQNQKDILTRKDSWRMITIFYK